MYVQDRWETQETCTPVYEESPLGYHPYMIGVLTRVWNGTGESVRWAV